MLTCFYMSNILILCSVLLELIRKCDAAHVKHDRWEAGALGAVDGWWASRLHSWWPMRWVHFFFFFFFRENYGTPEKVSYDFFFFFSKTFFLKKTILYDSHAKARIVLGWIYFKYQRSIFTYCILESSWWKRHNCGCLSCGMGVGVHGASSAWVFYLNMCLFWIMLPQAKLSRYFYFCIESHNWNMWNI